MTPPRSLPASDGHPWEHPGWADPNSPDLFWPTVAVIGAALATATWVGFTAARSLLRRLP